MAKRFGIQTVVVVGSGNVAGHLARALLKTGLKILQVCSQDIHHARDLAGELNADAVNSCSKINREADFYMLAVPDAKIAVVAAEMPPVRGIVCHTSGITAMKVLEKFQHCGVFYPFQTFSKNREADISDVPFCIEASSPAVLDVLKLLAVKLSKSVFVMDMAQREKLHVAGVLVNNFTNFLYAEAEDFLKDNGLDVSMLLPLIMETAAKVRNMSPDEAQTGPARRGDLTTIEKHLEMFKDRAELKEIYRIFTKQILKKYHE